MLLTTPNLGPSEYRFTLQVVEAGMSGLINPAVISKLPVSLIPLVLSFLSAISVELTGSRIHQPFEYLLLMGIWRFNSKFARL